MKRKIKLFCGLGLLSISAIALSVNLSSCSSANSTNPYAPYSAIHFNGDTTKENILRYTTSNNTTSFYNNDSSLFGSENANKYLDTNTIKKYYADESQKLVQKQLNNADNWKTIKTLYNADTAKDVSPTEYFDVVKKNKNEIPRFFYGVRTTENLVTIADIYNYCNIANQIFGSIRNLATNLITYAIHTNGEGINNATFQSVSNFNEQWKNGSTAAKQFIFGEYSLVGEGNNIYALWPSGISFDVANSSLTSSSNTNANGQDVIDNLDEFKKNTELGDINAPYPISDYDSNGIKTINEEITLTNIKVNYSWFKTEKSGGEYTNFSNVQNALTNDNKNLLAKMGMAEKKLTVESFSLPITDLTFNVTPEIYSYQNPWYSGVYCTVYTGLYNISQPIINTKTNKITSSSYTKYSYPTALQATIGATNENVNWQGLVQVRNNKPNALENFIDPSIYNVIKDVSDLQEIPYYQPNLKLSKQTNTQTYQIKLTGNTLTYTQVNNMLTILFLDPFNKANKIAQSAIYNNVNNLDKLNALNLYGLGLLVSNQAITDVSKDSLFNSFKNDLAFGNDKVKATNIANNNKYKTIFDLGQTSFNEIVKVKEITSGNIYQFNSNGIVVSNSNDGKQN